MKWSTKQDFNKLHIQKHGSPTILDIIFHNNKNFIPTYSVKKHLFLQWNQFLVSLKNMNNKNQNQLLN